MFNGFFVEYEGKFISESSGTIETSPVKTIILEDGSETRTSIHKSSCGGLEVKNVEQHYPDTALVNKWIEITNISKFHITITRIDSLHDILPLGSYRLKYFTSDWGKEFEPVDTTLAGTKILEVTKGRSSYGTHPWFSLTGDDGSILTASIAWSGNWIVRFEPVTPGRYRISGGLSNWSFSRKLLPGETMKAPNFLYVYMKEGTLNDTSVAFGKWGRKYWYMKNPLSESLPVEWNTWWPYEDKEVSEEIFRNNVDKCAEAGVEVCTLDAGWFGRSDEKSNWFNVRGDWHNVNTTRFPSGIRALSDYTHSKGLKFGIWCEIESLGVEADLTQLRPDIVARRDEKHLGYVCMGNPQSVSWAFGVLESLILEYNADWIKLDFNLDPGEGCNRTDHGHGEGDGLYEHYMGYYRLLEMITEKYPHVMLENCSSGGLRIDLGIMKHLHTSFLSDPDYPVHDLELIWGATTMLHPSKCLHWSWSQTREGNNTNIDKNPLKPDMKKHSLDYYVRISMLGGFGYSYRMTDLPTWIFERLKYHAGFYKNTVRKYIRDAEMYRLSEQALRNGGGDRWNVFQYVTASQDESIIFVFRLMGSESERVVKPVGLDSSATYTARYEDSGRCIEIKGSELMNQGLLFDNLEEEGSEVLTLKLSERS